MGWLFSSKKNVKCILVLERQLNRDDGMSNDREFQRWEKRYEEINRWDYSEKNAALCTGNGRWIFSSKRNTGSILMLTQQLKQMSIQYERSEKRDEQLDRWGSSSINYSIACSGQWIFSTNIYSESMLVLTQQLSDESSDDEEHGQYDELYRKVLAARGRGRRKGLRKKRGRGGWERRAFICTDACAF